MALNDVPKVHLAAVATPAIMLAAPAFGNSQGPPWMHNDRIIPEEDVRATEPVDHPVMKSFYPSLVFRESTKHLEHNLTISLAHSEYVAGGYMIWDYGDGNFTPSDGSKYVADSGGELSHDNVGNDWEITWTAPDSDVGDIHFSLAGNIVDGSGAPDAGDHWTILTFTVSAPETATPDADESLRTISVGDYESLFGQKSPEEIEAERKLIASGYLEQGNLYFWTTLSILIVAAVIQGEFYERRFGGGPPHLDMSLAMPQGIRRGAITLGLAVGFGWAVDTALPWGYTLVIGMCLLWGIFGFTER